MIGMCGGLVTERCQKSAKVLTGLVLCDEEIGVVGDSRQEVKLVREMRMSVV